MSSIPFGEQLKREREMRGVSIEEISAATRISTRFLEALEKEEWEKLPGGVFNRGFIRSVARFLGLDGDSMVAEYELERKFTSPEAPVAVAVPEEIPRNWRPAVALIAIFAALIVGGWFTYQRYALDISARLHGKAGEVGAPGEPIPQVLANAPATSTAPAASPSAPSANTATPADAPLALKIQAGKNADVKVVSDGATVFDGHMNVDQVQSFTARDSFQITSSESSALFIELNGHAVPPLGKPGEPGSITLTQKDLQSDSGGAH